MKRYIILLILLNLSLARAQMAKMYPYYYDVEMKPCDSSVALFLKEVYVTSEDFYYELYQIPGRLLLQSGFYLDSAMTTPNGVFKSYYLPDSTAPYAALRVKQEGAFCRGFVCGTWKSYSTGGLETVVEHYNNRGELDGLCEWNSTFKNSDYLDSSKTYSNGKLHGPSTFYSFGSVRSIYYYTDGNLDSVVYFNDEEVRISAPASTDHAAYFEGGEKTMYKILKSEKVLSPEAKALKISGTVVVQFSVNRQGEIGEIEVIETLHPLLDQEAIRLVSLLDYFVPAVRHNCEVDSVVRLEIKF